MMSGRECCCGWWKWWKWKVYGGTRERRCDCGIADPSFGSSFGLKSVNKGHIAMSRPKFDGKGHGQAEAYSIGVFDCRWLWYRVKELAF